MSNRKIVIIINPVAGRGQTIKLLPIIKDRFDKMSGIDYVVQVSKYKGNISEIVKDYLKNGYQEFIGVGGDGTLSEIINGINYENKDKIRVGIIPSGTGNDFVRSLNRNSEIHAILDRVDLEDTLPIDIGKVNDFYFINVCSFGIDGPIVEDTEKLKKIIPGPTAYLLSTLKAGLFFKANNVVLKIDDLEINKPLLLIAIGNGKFIGGGMNVCPDAIPNDGDFDICTVNSVSKTVFAKEISKIYKGRLKEVKEVNYYKGKNIIISDEKNQYHINADGTLIGKTPARISIIESAILFY